MASRGVSKKLSEQCAIIQGRLAAGELPPRAIDQRTYAGYGEGQLCDACGSLIGRGEVAYEVELPADTLTMHVGCFAVWVAQSGSNRSM